MNKCLIKRIETKPKTKKLLTKLEPKIFMKSNKSKSHHMHWRSLLITIVENQITILARIVKLPMIMASSIPFMVKCKKISG